jgi:iron complex outermembrane receptor protein
MASRISLPCSRAACTAALSWACLAAAAADETVTITGRIEPGSGLSGFPDAPAASMPLQAIGYGAQRLADANVERIGDLTRLDASVGDAYNAEGYWSIVAIRGYTLDNRFNYRRDGLPINAETSIALDNKERLELLKGTTGMQAGTSAPGGLVNLVVKRPVSGQRRVTLGWEGSGTLGLVTDIGDRSGAFGWRINAAYQHLDPMLGDTRGHRSLLAVAADWQIGPDSLIEVEWEGSRQQQPSAAGFSMLGDTVPDARNIDPRINLNRQPWNKPVVMNGNTASIRWQQRLGEDWRFKAHAMTQRLRSDDRTAFPYGVYDPNTYACAQWCDRFAPDGTFTYWQYISDNERRHSDALDLAFNGHAVIGTVLHRVETGVLQTRYQGRFQDQVFDIAGTGNIAGMLNTPPSPLTPDANTNRDERSTEFYLRDAIQVSQDTGVWAGLRHTRMHRESVRTSPASDGLRATRYDQIATLPWLALTHQLTSQTMLYASRGQGLQSDVAPNRSRYVNAGQVLPALKSRQTEVGVKHTSATWDAALTLFDIDQPVSVDIGNCDLDDSCVRQADGSEHHRGVEGQIGLRLGAWSWQFSAMHLDARRQGSSQTGANGRRPVNVPGSTLRLAAAYRFVTFPQLEMQGAVIAESERAVLPYDAPQHIPGWARVDLAARCDQRLNTTTITWRAGVDNAGNRRAWKESPYQFGHVYLYPLAPRTWRVSAQASF